VPEVSARAFALASDAALVSIEGAIGPLDGDDVREALDAALQPPICRLVVDVTGARLDDPAPLSSLLDAARLLRARDGIVAIVTPRGSPLRGILATTGLDDAFALYDSRRAALDDLDLDDPR
jgi:anti-anti-sigma regulatory factor